MCRLTLLTTTPDAKFTATMKQLVFHLTMVYSVADDGQKYGAGVSDGLTTKKSGSPYTELGQSWLNNLGPERVWLGHVRKPSIGTDMQSALAAHPYDFDIGENPFTMAHNGSIEPILSEAPLPISRRIPDTDTYRAGVQLVELLQGARITRDAIQRWLATFDTRTSSSFLFIQGNQAIVVRGERQLWTLTLGNGYLINTSRIVLTGVRNMLTQFFHIKTPEPVEVPMYSYMRLLPGTHIPRPIPLRVQYRLSPQQLMYIYNRRMDDLEEPEDSNLRDPERALRKIPTT